jgi:hypothetical protein
MDDFDVVTGSSPQLQSLKPAVPPPRTEPVPAERADTKAGDQEQEATSSRRA